MKNRISENPGRVLITPENGSAPFYVTMTRADNPTQEGDPLNKNTLLKDATAAMYGLPDTAVPDDVLALLKTLVDNAQESANEKATIKIGSYVGTGTYGEKNPCVLSFNRVPFFVAILASSDGIVYPYYGKSCYWMWITSPYALSKKFQHNKGLGYQGYDADLNNSAGKTTEDKKSIIWYDPLKSEDQLNKSGVTYYYFALFEN